MGRIPSVMGKTLSVHPSTTREFKADVSDVVAARRFAIEAVGSWNLGTDDVALVVSELAANAVVHARTPFVLALSLLDDQVVLIEVTDHDHHMPLPAQPSVWATNGRGLMIVDKLAAAWGARATIDGDKILWAEVRVPQIADDQTPQLSRHT